MEEILKRRVERNTRELKEGRFSTPKNCETLLRFYDFSKARNLSSARLVIYYDKLKLACDTIGDKDFNAWERGDIENLFSRLAEKGYSAWSIETEKAVLKTFFKWFYDTEECPKFLKWLKGESPPNKLTRENLLTPKDIEKMLKATENSMHQCLLAAYTTGARPNEIYNIKLKDITDFGDMIKIHVSLDCGKMSKKAPPRPVYIQRFAEFFRPWVQHHPHKNNPEAWLFSNGKRMNYRQLREVVVNAGEKAKLGKKVFPYLFRHSVLTWLYASKNPVYARRVAGHCAGSKMEATYCHLDENDLDAEMRGKREQETNGFDFSKAQETVNMGELLTQFANENPEWRENLVKSMREWRISKMGA